MNCDGDVMKSIHQTHDTGETLRHSGSMSATEYTTALTTLNLTNDQAAIWLGVGRSTAFRYATKGPSGPAARAVGMAMRIAELERWNPPVNRHQWVRHSELTAAVGLPDV